MLSSAVLAFWDAGSSRNISAALLSLALASSVIAAPLRPGSSTRAATPISSAQIAPRNLRYQSLKLDLARQNHLLLRAAINGKPALLVVDTGAPFSAIAADRVAYFGATPLAEDSLLPRQISVNGTYNNVGMVKTLQLGALTLIDEPMVTIDLGRSSRAATLINEGPIDGIIGADILFATDAVIDCNQQTLTLKVNPNALGPVPKRDYRGYTKVPMTVSPSHSLYVKSRVNGQRATLWVDTGAFTTVLHQSFARRLKIPLRDTDFRSGLVNLKRRSIQRATIDRLAIGGLQINGKEVGVIDLEGLIRADLLAATPPLVGLLGSDILRRHNGVIDFRTRTLYLKR